MADPSITDWITAGCSMVAVGAAIFAALYTKRSASEAAKAAHAAAALVEGDYASWRNSSTEDFEAAGQQEMLNWCPMLGAMEELGARLEWSSFIETHVFNSNKVFAVYNAA